MQGTYPHNKMSRSKPVLSRVEACQSVGSDMPTQIRILVGRRMHANAASTSDRRSLDTRGCQLAANAQGRGRAGKSRILQTHWKDELSKL
jgi:hypothetical protein